MALTHYPAVFYQESDGTYFVGFPDLNFLSTQGDNFNHAMEMAIDCLAGYVYYADVDGNELAEPSKIDTLDYEAYLKEIDPDTYDPNNVIVNMVSVDVEEYAKKHFNKAVQKTVTIPQWMATKAEQEKLKLSKVLQDALREKFAE